VLGLKLGLLLAILVAGALGASLPVVYRQARARAHLLGWGNAFAAGVFLAAGLMHMLPDADEIWSALGWRYPMAFAFASVAFLFMLLVEHVLLPEREHEEVHAPSAERFASLADRHHDSLSAYTVLTALSIHSLLAGLALGAQPELSRALVIFLAIVAHKSAAGFALGVSLARSPVSSAQAWGLVAIFASATPLGGLVGALLGEAVEGRGAALLEASFLSIAAGTFVYVATFDILRDEFPSPGGRLTKWLVLASGVVAMGLLALWV
jgi:zinc transporter 1/2/3